MGFQWNPDPVERVFGIVMAGGIIAVAVLAFLGPDEILGMPLEYLMLVLFFGVFGAGLGLRVVRWFNKRDE